MKHWSEKYILINYKDMNCSKFVEHVLRDHFNINLQFPQSKGSLFNQSHQVRTEVPKFSHKTSTPVDGDLVLMHGKREMCHVGLYVRIGWTEYVLHTESSMKTAALHKLKDLFMFGYSVEGFYKWKM